MPQRVRSIVFAAVAIAAMMLSTTGNSTAASAVGRSARSTAQVSVSPWRGLAAGDTIRVYAPGITPLASVRVIQCDAYLGDPDQDCNTALTTTASASGVVWTTLTLRDPVYEARGDASPRPVYCRADQCRIFLVWTDSGGNEQVKQSTRLRFPGLPATVAITPAQQVYRNQTVQVTGTAHGAQGRRVQIFEEACYNIIQGWGCEDQGKVRTTKVNSHGSFAISYVVHRFFSRGDQTFDCNDIAPLYCEVTAVVLNSDGQPDDTFGVANYGQPAALLSFLTGM